MYSIRSGVSHQGARLKVDVPSSETDGTLTYSSSDVYAMLDKYRSECQLKGIDIPPELRFMFGSLAEPNHNRDRTSKSIRYKRDYIFPPPVSGIGLGAREATPALQSVHSYVPLT